MATRIANDDKPQTERAYAVARELGMTTAELRSLTSEWEHDWKVTSQMQSLTAAQIEQVRKARQPKGRGARSKKAAPAKAAVTRATRAPKAAAEATPAAKTTATRGRKPAVAKAVAAEEKPAAKAAATRGRKPAAAKAVAAEERPAAKAAATRGRKPAAAKAAAAVEEKPAAKRGRKPAAAKAAPSEVTAPAEAPAVEPAKPARGRKAAVAPVKATEAPAVAPAKERKEPRRKERAPAAAPAAPTGLSAAEVLEKGQAFLQSALAEMGLTQIVVQARQEDRRFTFNLVGKDARSLVGRVDAGATTQTLDSLQSLLTQALFGGDRNAGVIILDVDGFRTGRVEALKGAAERLGEFVRRTGKAVRFAGMNAIDRRAIHLNLGKARDLLAESEGYGAARRLKVWLKREPANVAPADEGETPTGGDEA